MKIQKKTHSKEETIKLGKLISGFLSRGSIITLTGDLGAGKTTFTKGVGAGLGIEDDINSPTFNILKCYFHKPLSLYHIDAYRLEDVAPVQKNIGLEEVIEGDGVCLIECSSVVYVFVNNGSSSLKRVAEIETTFFNCSPVTITVPFVAVSLPVNRE